MVLATKPRSAAAKDVAATYRTIAPAARTAHGELTRIEVPARNRADWTEFLGLFNARVKAIEAIGDRADDVTADEYTRLATKDPGLYDRETELTRALGLTVCGQSTSLGV